MIKRKRLKSLITILVITLIIQGSLFLISPQSIFANPDEFKVSDYGSVEDSNGYSYRGYSFTVSTKVIVTSLIGGGEGPIVNFIVGLYEDTDGNYAPDNLLASTNITSAGRNQIGNIAAPVVLSPGKNYILAEGLLSEPAAYYYVLNSLNATAVVNGSPIIETWFPDNYSLNFGIYGSPSVILGITPSTGNHHKPEIGFQYTLTSSSIIEPVWVRDTQMKCKAVWVNENGNFKFSFIYPYATNNWVKIYDASGKEVYIIDMSYDNTNIVVDLPDGQYTVKTFHDQPEPIQTFVIGKP